MNLEEAVYYFGNFLGRKIDFSMLMNCQSCDIYVEGLCNTDGAECFFCARPRSYIKSRFHFVPLRQTLIPYITQLGAEEE